MADKHSRQRPAKKSVTAENVAQQKFRPKQGRPTATQALAIELSILSAATESFLTVGYDATSMDGIARSAKVSKETLYKRYSEKEALFRAVVRDRVAAASAEASKENSMLGDTLEKRLKHHAKTVMTHAVSAENIAFDRLMSGAGTPRDMVRSLYEMRPKLMLDLLTREIREFAPADGNPARHPDHIAEILISTWYGWIRLETSLREVSVREAVAFAHRTIDVLIAGRAGW